MKLRTKVPYMGMFGVEFQKTILIFEISIIKIGIFVKFTKNLKMLKFSINCALFGYYWVSIL